MVAGEAAPLSPASLDALRARFFAMHAEDPRTRVHDGRQAPESVVYHQRLEAHLARVITDPEDALRVAAMAQHVRRWEIPRSDHPLGHAGYHAWRKAASRHHVTIVEGVLEDAGLAALFPRVRALLLKANLHKDAASQALEDAVCLTFVELDLDAFAARTEDTKLRDVVEKTLAKMSELGRALVMKDLAAHPPEVVARLGA